MEKALEKVLIGVFLFLEISNTGKWAKHSSGRFNIRASNYFDSPSEGEGNIENIMTFLKLTLGSCAAGYHQFMLSQLAFSKQVHALSEQVLSESPK